MLIKMVIFYNLLYDDSDQQPHKSKVRLALASGRLYRRSRGRWTAVFDPLTAPTPDI